MFGLLERPAGLVCGAQGGRPRAEAAASSAEQLTRDPCYKPHRGPWGFAEACQ